MQEIQVESLDWDDPLEKEMATHFSILAWRIPWAEEPGGLHPWGCKELDTSEQLNHHPNLQTSLMNHWLHGHLQLQNILGNPSLSLLFRLKQKHCHTQPKQKIGECTLREQWFSKRGLQTSTVSIT